jgi:hypothetical protein
VATRTRGWSRGFGQKIIGRSAILGNRRFGSPGITGNRSSGMLTLIDQVAREQRRGVFLEPLVEQRRNLFAEIGGMPESGKLIGREAESRNSQEAWVWNLGTKTSGARDRGNTSQILTE